MLVRDLTPGMLIKPEAGAHWVLVTWRGAEGKKSGDYLTVSTRAHLNVHHSDQTPAGTDPILYIGPLGRSQDGMIHTPGRQLVLLNGDTLSVDPGSWRSIQPA